jgi:hypothetical protein
MRRRRASPVDRYGDFEWDEAKAASSLAKHGVSFEEATSVFSDPSYLLVRDESAPNSFWAIGLTGLARVLTVVHVERGPRVRLVSARKATRTEAEAYERRRF